VSLTFTTGANDQNIHAELTIYNNLPPLTAGIQRSFVDNVVLEAAVSTKVAFQYNDRGQRVKKESYNNQTTYSTYYVRDAAGSVMAVYTKTAGPFTYQPLQVKEHSIYGSGRIGVFKRENTLPGGYALYELTDHLGNVRAVIMKSGGNVLSLTAKTDYYPFGMPMPNRHTTDNNYRYAFQGQEKDNETGMEAFELRLWDGRIGRWLTVDPYHEFFSPYVGMGNNPISLIDPDGGSTTPTDFVNTKTGETVYINDGMDQVVFVNDKDWAFIQGMETARTWNKPDSERYFSIIGKGKLDFNSDTGLLTRLAYAEMGDFDINSMRIAAESVVNRANYRGTYANKYSPSLQASTISEVINSPGAYAETPNKKQFKDPYVYLNGGGGFGTEFRDKFARAKLAKAAYAAYLTMNSKHIGGGVIFYHSYKRNDKEAAWKYLIENQVAKKTNIYRIYILNANGIGAAAGLNE
jgi:RHS repeat-associated protein